MQGSFRFFEQLFFGCLPGGGHGGENSSTLSQDFQVGHPPALHGQLVLPPAAEDQMGMGIHQTRGHKTPLCIDGLPVDFRGSSGPDLPDFILLSQHPGILQQLHPGLRTGGGAQRGGKLTDIFN